MQAIVLKTVILGGFVTGLGGCAFLGADRPSVLQSELYQKNPNLAYNIEQLGGDIRGLNICIDQCPAAVNITMNDDMIADHNAYQSFGNGFEDSQQQGWNNDHGNFYSNGQSMFVNEQDSRR